MSHIVVHYSDIGTKGKNRVFFERMLMRNINQQLPRVARILRRYGKIVVETENNQDINKIIATLTTIPGISSFALAKKSQLNLADIKKNLSAILKGRDFRTFRITTRRSNKNFSKSSQKMNIILGDYIRTKLNKKVNLDNPELTIFLEIGEKEVFIYLDKYSGIGGLPVGSSGKVVASLSGGIDSPVASFFAMRKGLRVIFVHIFNKTIIQKDSQMKVIDIVKKLSTFQGDSKLFLVPFEKIQKAIITNIPSKYRMIVYRRFMMRILENVARGERAKGIVTGDSLGQVASQTIENLSCIYEGLSLPILPPLIGMNKEEIIKIAKEIGTYRHSILPYPDCCSFLIAKHPETQGKIEDIKKMEKLIAGKNKLIQDSVGRSVVKTLVNR